MRYHVLVSLFYIKTTYRNDRLFFCGGSVSYLELFEKLFPEQEAVYEWNIDMRKFIENKRKPALFEVIY